MVSTGNDKPNDVMYYNDKSGFLVIQSCVIVIVGV